MIIWEPYEELRARLLYLAADGDGLTMHIRQASGPRLEEIAAALRLRRRCTVSAIGAWA